MSRSHFILLLAPFIFVASAAHAMFIGNYASWKKLSPEMQEIYLIGVMDTWTRTSARGEPPWMKIARIGVTHCVKEQDIGSAALAEFVNSHYRDHTADWRVPPAAVLKHLITGTCSADINAERKTAGLPVWERKPPQVSRDSEKISHNSGAE